MSYKRKFTRYIDVPYKIVTKDPKWTLNSEGNWTEVSSGSIELDINGTTYNCSIGSSGGRDKFEHYATQVVEVEVNVDTDPFDDATEICRQNVDELTGSVVATEAAEIASLKKNSRQIADTIVTGFFKQVKSEVTSQIMEKKQAVESRLMHLKVQAEELDKKRKQMETDYQRVAARYTKIIDDLNNELELRVKALDQPVYKMHELVQAETNRMLNGDLVDVAAVTSAENATILNQIQASLCKKHAKESIDKCQQFLYTQYRTDQAIQRAVVDSPELKGNVYLPVFYLDKVENKDVSNLEVHCDSNYVPEEASKAVYETIKVAAGNNGMNSNQREELKPYFSSEMAMAYNSSASSHDERVKDVILKLFNK